jgi:hypothetical protein
VWGRHRFKAKMIRWTYSGILLPYEALAILTALSYV